MLLQARRWQWVSQTASCLAFYDQHPVSCNVHEFWTYIVVQDPGLNTTLPERLHHENFKLTVKTHSIGKAKEFMATLTDPAYLPHFLVKLLALDDLDMWLEQ